MYLLIRLMLIAALGLTAYSVILFCLMGGVWCWVALGVLLLLVALKSKGKVLWAYGTAACATEGDLRWAGMLAAKRGLILGRLVGGRALTFFERVRVLLSRRIPARDACEQFLGPAKRKDGGPLVRLPNAVHTAVFAPTGVGKGVSFVVPFLLTCEESCVVVDFKGELASLTAGARRRMGHDIVILDPFGSCAKTTMPFKPSTFNPLDFIDKDSPAAIDDCNALAQSLVVRTGEEKEPHWLDAAESWIAGMTATAVQYGRPDKGTRSLQTVRDMLADPQKLETAVKLMCESDAWGGMLARMGRQLTHFVDKEKSSTLTSTGRFLRFLDTPAVAAITKASSFDPATLRVGKMTVFLVLPPSYMHSHAALLRMWIVSLLRAVVQGGLHSNRCVHCVLDEASSLGHLQVVEDMLAIGRGYSVRLQFYFQSVGQLKKCFPQGQEQTLMSNVTQVFFGVNDKDTAEYVSARLGEQTIVVESGGSSRGQSGQLFGKGGVTQSTNSNRNWQQVGRKLLKPEEVLALSPRVAITFAPGIRPICTQLLRYYEEKKSLWKQRGRLHGIVACCQSFFKATVLLLAAGLVAFAATKLKGGFDVRTGGQAVQHRQGEPQQRAR